MQDETTYMLEPTAFHSMREAQYLTDQLEESLSKLSNVAANIKPQVVEMFSEMVNNAAEHGMSDAGAHCHVRLMPHRRSLALDSVITDRGPGIRATLERNPNLQWNQTSRPSGSPSRNSPQAPAIPLGALASGPPSWNARSPAGNYRSTLAPAGSRSTVQTRWNSRPPPNTRARPSGSPSPPDV